MNKDIDYIKKARYYLLDGIKDLSADQLNQIPEGFNNNILWNLAHMVAAQQGICYLRAGAQLVIEQEYYNNYKPGTKPQQYIDKDEIQKLKDLMISTLDRLAADQQTNVFANYNTWSTRYGADLTNVDDAIAFLLFHDGLHAGVTLAISKLVKIR